MTRFKSKKPRKAEQYQSVASDVLAQYKEDGDIEILIGALKALASGDFADFSEESKDLQKEAIVLKSYFRALRVKGLSHELAIESMCERFPVTERTLRRLIEGDYLMPSNLPSKDGLWTYLDIQLASPKSRKKP